MSYEIISMIMPMCFYNDNIIEFANIAYLLMSGKNVIHIQGVSKKERHFKHTYKI